MRLWVIAGLVAMSGLACGSSRPASSESDRAEIERVIRQSVWAFAHADWERWCSLIQADGEQDFVRSVADERDSSVATCAQAQAALHRGMGPEPTPVEREMLDSLAFSNLQIEGDRATVDVSYPRQTGPSGWIASERISLTGRSELRKLDGTWKLAQGGGGG